MKNQPANGWLETNNIKSNRERRTVLFACFACYYFLEETITDFFLLLSNFYWIFEKDLFIKIYSRYFRLAKLAAKLIQPGVWSRIESKNCETKQTILRCFNSLAHQHGFSASAVGSVRIHPILSYGWHDCVFRVLWQTSIKMCDTINARQTHFLIWSHFR